MEEPESCSQLAKVQARVHDLRGRLDRLIDAYATGTIEKSEFESRIRSFQPPTRPRSCDVVEPPRSANQSERHQPAVATLTRLTEQVGCSLETASEDLKRELFVALISGSRFIARKFG